MTKSPPRRPGRPPPDDDEARTLLTSGEREFGDVDPRLEALALPGLLAVAGPARAVERPRPPEPRSPPRAPTRSGTTRREGRPAPAEAPQAQEQVPAKPRPAAERPGVQAALDSARDHGVYFTPFPEGGRVPLSLQAAVREAERRLEGLRGVEAVAAGKNEHGEPVVLVTVGPTFGEAELAHLPERVGDVPTLLVLPFDALPLRRAR